MVVRFNSLLLFFFLKLVPLTALKFYGTVKIKKHLWKSVRILNILKFTNSRFILKLVANKNSDKSQLKYILLVSLIKCF